ncbi:DUF805 domain-containing protein [Leucobacter sp. W1153]|uniref:DUF805 domain-containing protein n=1 Tax=unclassified Leucobacter TaxID=2621730 RepID=UPI003F302B20
MTTAPATPTNLYGNPGPGEPYDGATAPSVLNRPLYGATFGQAISRFFKNYATFSGRASRSEYWLVTLFMLILSAVFGVLIGITTATAGLTEEGNAELPGTAIALIVAFGVFGLATIVPSIALQWRRLHDVNLAGPFYFLALIPSVGGLILFILSLLPPKPEGRRFDK